LAVVANLNLQIQPHESVLDSKETSILYLDSLLPSIRPETKIALKKFVSLSHKLLGISPALEKSGSQPLNCSS